jgi:hypothetical protein
MKKLRFILFLLAAASGMSCSFGAKEHRLYVMGLDGKPLQGVSVKAGYTTEGGDHVIYREETDEEGRFSFSGDVKTEISFTVDARGYYTSQIRVDSTGMDNQGYAIPKDTNSEITLKPIKDPIPLHAYAEWELVLPAREKKLGYDIIVADWVAPYGKGKSADIFFEYTSEYRDLHDYNGRLVMTFPNEYDGFIEFEVDFLNGSELKSAYYAPDSGYTTEKTWEFQRRPHVMFSNTGERSGNFNDYNKPTSYWLRLRTVATPEGDIKRAIYAKIYHDINFGGVHEKAFIKFTMVYVNPNVNDRNLEFDRDNNLFENLKGRNQPRYP